MTATRRLAAILAADVAGYSRLMGADEEGTHHRLRAHFAQLVEPKISEHKGRTVKNTGDGLLAEFASVVDAVRCAAEIQRAMIDCEAGLPEDRRIRFRIGINLGDVIAEDNDIFGDGVNVAARLEALAEPGGICISRTVRDQIRDKLPYSFEDLGEQSVKNIARPVRVYRFGVGAPTGPSTEPPHAAVKASLPLPDKPSVAVLPFANMSSDPEQEFFADGISEDVITALSRYPSLFVISRNSSFTYKGRSVDVKQIGRELGVRYVLEGSLRKSGNRIRVTAQLVEAETGRHVWAERYDRELADIFAVQDEITEAVTIAVAPSIREAELQRAMRKPPTLGRRRSHSLSRMIVPARRVYRRENFAAIRRHLDRREVALTAPHDIESNAHANRERFRLGAGLLLGHDAGSALSIATMRTRLRPGAI
jgi:adenylate cyclase